MALGKSDVLLPDGSLDAATVPPTIFVLLSQGGFVLWSQDTAKQLGMRGFSLLQHDLSADEASWFAAKSPSWAAQGKPGTVWFAACPTGASLDANKQPICGQSLPKGIVEVPAKGGDSCSVKGLPDAAEGEASPIQLQYAQRIAPPGATVCFRYFGGNPVFPEAQHLQQVNATRETLAVYDSLTRSVDQIESWRKIAGNPYTSAQATSILNARAWLASVSPIVMKARAVLPNAASSISSASGEAASGSGNVRSFLRRSGPLPVYRSNVRPQAPYAYGSRATQDSASSALAITGTPGTVVAAAVVIAIVALSPSVAIWACSQPQTQRAGFSAQADLAAAMNPVIQDAALILSNAASTPAQRQAARATLRNLSTLMAAGMKTQDPGDKAPIPWGTIAVVGSVGLGVLAGVAYMVSPVVKAKAQLAWYRGMSTFDPR